MAIETKTFEVRDEGTHIPAMAHRFTPTEAEEDYQLRRSGYGVGKTYVILTALTDLETQYDWSLWKGRRSMPTAHRFIESQWDELASGDVVDVEFILGEKPEKKITERIYDDALRARFHK